MKLISNNELTVLENRMLSVISGLKHNAYGVTIRREFDAFTMNGISYGKMYITLDRLVENGYLKTRWGGATEIRGGRRKKFYYITNKGK